jgi:Domain of unknown function (DUF397)
MTATDLDLSRAEWRKSTYSGNGGACVEVAAVWRTSTYSNNGGQCVEVARGEPRLVAIRDSKDPAGPNLAFTPAQWQSFVRTVKA